MNINIYTGYEEFFPRGTITISYDRISHINLYLPRVFAVRWSVEREIAIDYAEKRGELFLTHKIYQRETDYRFTIKKISKAEMAYRKGKMTHQILSNGLMDYIEHNYLYTKLKWWQVLKIKYNSNKFIWQTKEFKKHIYFHVGTYLVSALLGGFGTFLYIKYYGNSKQKNKPENTHQLVDSTTKNNRMNNVNIPVYKFFKIPDSLRQAEKTSIIPKP